MSTTNINVRVEASLKKEAQILFDDLGLSMSSAITIFLKYAVSHNGIPFEVKLLAPNQETQTALAEYEEMKKHPYRYKRYNSFSEAMDEIFKDD